MISERRSHGRCCASTELPATQQHQIPVTAHCLVVVLFVDTVWSENCVFVFRLESGQSSPSSDRVRSLPTRPVAARRVGTCARHRDVTENEPHVTLDATQPPDASRKHNLPARSAKTGIKAAVFIALVALLQTDSVSLRGASTVGDANVSNTVEQLQFREIAQFGENRVCSTLADPELWGSFTQDRHAL